VDCKATYGTEGSLYALDGNRFYPGTDEKHLGGDIWVADAALEMMNKNPDWKGMFLTFGAIDKFGHMLGETDGETPHSFQTPMHLKEIAKIADQQLGRLLDELVSKKLLDKTLIVQTADHGAQTDTIYLGAGGGKSESFWMGRIAKIANVRMAAVDTSIRLWIKNYEVSKKDAIVNHLKEISKVTRIYSLVKKENRFEYQEEYNNIKSEPAKFQKWAVTHDLELVNSMANERAPQFVALLADEVGFGKLGDHGGNQENVQRIPLIVVSPGLAPRKEVKPARLFDIRNIINKEFGI
jgi:membrane-anchored protein YejM (alkaline phosphatase superfamily)